MKKMSLYMLMLTWFGISACQGNRNNESDRMMDDPVDPETPYLERNDPLDTMRIDSIDSVGTPLPPLPGVPMD